MKKQITKLLLRLLNSSWLNKSPCEYGYIGNITAFSYEHLVSEEAAKPGITVKEILERADFWKTIGHTFGLKVVEDGVVRDADVWDLQELKQALSPKEK